MSIRLSGKIIAGNSKSTYTGFEIGDIGISSLGIDENQNRRRYLNGQIIISEQFVAFTEKLKSASALHPTLICTEEEWQTTSSLSVGGQCGKFVMDDEAGTIRLPKIIMPIQGLTDLSKLAEIVEAGLPTHTHTRGTMNITGKSAFNTYGITSGNSPSNSGAFYESDGGWYGGRAGTELWRASLNFNASRNWTGSTSTGNYSKSLANSDTVQQEQIQYPYFIQVATGVEESIDTTRAVEINNPFFLGMSQYFESTPNNPSWVKSTGTYLSKAVYPDYYDWLLKIYNGTETQEGVSVKLATDTEITDYDFVINQTDETFRLPLLNGSESLVSSRYEDLTLGDSETSYTAPANGYVFFNGYFSSSSGVFRITSSASSMGSSVTGGDAYNQANRTFLPVKAGDIFYITYSDLKVLYQFRFIYAQGNGDLYYYMGDGIVNPQLVNVARIEETLVNKADINANNFTASGKSSIVGFCTPSSKRVILTIGASIAKYTAPANGYFVATVHGETGKYFYLRCPEAKMRTGGAYAGMAMDCFLPIKKGHTLEVHYSSLTRTELFCFVYAEGEV